MRMERALGTRFNPADVTLGDIFTLAIKPGLIRPSV